MRPLILGNAARLLRAVLAGALLSVLATATGPRWIEASRELGTCDDPAHDHAEHLAPTRTEKRGRFEALADVTLSNKVEDKLNNVAAKFEKRTGKTFVVTSGTRDPDLQAELMVGKFEAGDDLISLYKDKTAILEVKRAFDEARAAKKTRVQIVAQVASVIRAQIKRGVFISAHLKAGAADVRSTTMTSTEKRAFIEVVHDVGGFEVMFESTPPHFHLQVD